MDTIEDYIEEYGEPIYQKKITGLSRDERLFADVPDEVAVLKTGESKFESDSFKECYDFCENGKHDGIWDRKEDDWAMTIEVEYK